MECYRFLDAGVLRFGVILGLLAGFAIVGEVLVSSQRLSLEFLFFCCGFPVSWGLTVGFFSSIEAGVRGLWVLSRGLLAWVAFLSKRLVVFWGPG